MNDAARRIGQGAVLLAPLGFLHARSLGDACIVAACAVFLLRSADGGGFGWLRATWVRLALAWWGWLMVASAVSGDAASVAGAIAAGRLPLFVAAMRFDLLQDARVRRAAYAVMAACAAYIALGAVFQFAVGVNFYGFPPNGDGELTGPFGGPRAGPPLARLWLPALLPVVAWVLGGGGTPKWQGAGSPPSPGPSFKGRGDATPPSPLEGDGRGGGWRHISQWARTPLAGAMVGAGAAVMLLIGQRMPLVLSVLGIALAAVYLRRLRPLVAGVGVLLAAMLVASPVIAPGAHHRLIDKFAAQMATFSTTHYGLLYARSLAMAQDAPWLGYGFDSFRDHCPDPPHFRAAVATQPADGGGAAICTTHNHSFYAQALTDAGLPGLALFTALSVAWLAALGARLRDAPLRVGLFAAAVIALWPVASTSGFYTMPLAGWFFWLLGFGLALSPARPGSAPVPRRTAPASRPDVYTGAPGIVP